MTYTFTLQITATGQQFELTQTLDQLAAAASDYTKAGIIILSQTAA